MDELEKLSKENSWFEEYLTERLKHYSERIEDLENRIDSLEQNEREISLFNSQRNYSKNHS